MNLEQFSQMSIDLNIVSKDNFVSKDNLTSKDNIASNDHPIHINHSATSVRDAVKTALTKYFINLEGASASNIYDLVISEVEKPLLETVMRHAANNQSKAAKWLGLSRNTLRKLLEKHAL